MPPEPEDNQLVPIANAAHLVDGNEYSPPIPIDSPVDSPKPEDESQAQPSLEDTLPAPATPAGESQAQPPLDGIVPPVD